jgi:hypothetical protein
VYGNDEKGVKKDILTVAYRSKCQLVETEEAGPAYGRQLLPLFTSFLQQIAKIAFGLFKKSSCQLVVLGILIRNLLNACF